MKLTKGKISKLYSKNKQSVRRKKNGKGKTGRNRTFRKTKGLNLANKSLKSYYNRRGGAPDAEEVAPVVEEVAPIVQAPVVEEVAPVVQAPEEVAPVVQAPVVEGAVAEGVAPVVEPIVAPVVEGVEGAPIVAPVAEGVAPVEGAPVEGAVAEGVAPVEGAPVEGALVESVEPIAPAVEVAPVVEQAPEEPAAVEQAPAAVEQAAVAVEQAPVEQAAVAAVEQAPTPVPAFFNISPTPEFIKFMTSLQKNTQPQVDMFGNTVDEAANAVTGGKSHKFRLTRKRANNSNKKTKSKK